MTDETRQPPNWDAVKMDYLGGVKMTDIYDRHRITKGQFDAQRQRAGWPVRHKTKINRERLVGRLFWLINHHVAAMERAMDEGIDTDVNVINQLVGTLGKLISFDSGAAKSPQRRRDTADLMDIREKLVRRIEELKRN